MMREWLKNAREKKGYSQQYVSEKLDVSRQYYNQIETGIRQLKMDITLACKLSVVLELPIYEILKNEDDFFQEVMSVRNAAKNCQM